MKRQSWDPDPGLSDVKAGALSSVLSSFPHHSIRPITALLEPNVRKDPALDLDTESTAQGGRLVAPVTAWSGMEGS